MSAEQKLAAINVAMAIVRERRREFINTNIAVWRFLNHVYLHLEAQQNDIGKEILDGVSI